MSSIQKTGEKFDLNSYLQARLDCIACTDRIFKKIELGMTEREIKNLVEVEFKKINVTKFWHPTKIRIGADTVKSFRELSLPELKIEDGELIFLDLGPVFGDHEADYGRTITFGAHETHPLTAASQKVFVETSNAWKTQKLSGVELFEFATREAKKMGYELNPKMAGHRLGDFPHQVFSQQKLFEYDEQPLPNLWVLEIHLVDPKLHRGAFFEDIMM